MKNTDTNLLKQIMDGSRRREVIVDDIDEDDAMAWQA